MSNDLYRPDYEDGTAVMWDGDLWFLETNESTIWPLGHTRCPRTVGGSQKHYDVERSDLIDVNRSLILQRLSSISVSKPV